MSTRAMIVLTLLAIGATRASACSSYWPSVGLGATAQLTDILSSRGRYEYNPVLGRSTFGYRQAVVKAGVFGGVTLGTYLMVRTEPKACRVATYVNYGGAGLTFGVSLRNWTGRR